MKQLFIAAILACASCHAVPSFYSGWTEVFTPDNDGEDDNDTEESSPTHESSDHWEIALEEKK